MGVTFCYYLAEISYLGSNEFNVQCVSLLDFRGNADILQQRPMNYLYCNSYMRGVTDKIACSNSDN